MILDYIILTYNLNVKLNYDTEKIYLETFIVMTFPCVHVINKIQKKKYPRFFQWKCSKLGLSLSEAKELQENTLISSTHFLYRTYILFRAIHAYSHKKVKLFFVF